MKKPVYDSNWPDSWKVSYNYDLIELYEDMQHLGYTYAYKNRLNTTLNIIDDVLPANSCILDLAAAQGNFSIKLAEMGYKVTWNDLRSELADYTKLKYEYGELDFVPGNIFELNLEKKFDLVLITEIIEHVAHPDDFMKKAAGLVKEGGYILMTTPNGNYFRFSNPRFSDCKNPEKYEHLQFQPNSDGHIFLLHTDEICILAHKANLKIMEFKLISNPLTNGHIKLSWLLNFLPGSVVKAVEIISNKMPLWISRYFHTTSLVLMKKL